MADTFIGFAALDATLNACLLTDDADVPTDATGSPSYRVYGENGLMNNGSGTISTFRDTGSITGATNASPIVITSNGHGLVTGQRVTISGVGGNTAANGTFVVTVLTSNTFSLDGSTGNGTYTSGGTWHQSGLYLWSFTPTSGNGFDHGVNYWVLFTFVVSGTTKSTLYTFGVT